MNIDKCPRCGLRHSSEDCPSTMAAFHLSRMDPDYSAPAAPQAPSGQQAEPTDERIEAIIRKALGTCRIGVAYDYEDVWAAVEAALAGQQSERPAVKEGDRA